MSIESSMTRAKCDGEGVEGKRGRGESWRVSWDDIIDVSVRVRVSRMPISRGPRKKNDNRNLRRTKYGTIGIGAPSNEGKLKRMTI